jgi:endonuclease-3
MKARRVARILERSLGTPRQVKKLPSSLEMLIATILSQNTNDKNSHRAYVLLRKRFRTWEELARAPVKSIVAAIRVGGMANQKSARIKDVLARIKTRFGGYTLAPLQGMTDDEAIQELTRMNGVGVKTAACVLLFSMGRDVFPVDTHVHRLCGRLGLNLNAKTPDQTFVAMRELFPPGKGYSFHTNLIRFGRKICRSNNPACGECPLYNECAYDKKRILAVKRAVRATADHDFMLLDHV